MSTELTPQDAVLIEFQAAPVLTGFPVALTAMGRAVGAKSISAHRDQDGDAVAAYLWNVTAADIRALAKQADERLKPFAAGAIEATRLKGIKRLKGACFGYPPTCHYVVRTDAAPGWDEELQRWYDEEHLAGLAAVNGNVLSQRALCLDEAPQYYACYDLLGPDVPESAAWLDVRSSPWSDRVRPKFTNTRRTMFCDLFRVEL